MTFELEDHWVWDFWFADDGDTFHLYYLHAPKSLGDPQLRHRNARIGHATSTDLRVWRDHGAILSPGNSGDFDETATWTGSVVRAQDGTWRMFYTGARFLDDVSHANIESIGMATSTDLHTWSKLPGPVVTADPRWYETLGTSSWPEEAWRDPWVFANSAGNGWHMLITARGAHGDEFDRAVIGHAVSSDLNTWTVRPPLSDPGSGFKHLEVLQLLTSHDGSHLLFSCDTGMLSGARSRGGETGGVWVLDVSDLSGRFDPASARLLTDEHLYSGRAITDRNGTAVLLAFHNIDDAGAFIGGISDPIPLTRLIATSRENAPSVGALS